MAQKISLLGHFEIFQTNSDCQDCFRLSRPQSKTQMGHMLPGRCHRVTGRCHMVPGRYHMVLGRCHMVQDGVTCYQECVTLGMKGNSRSRIFPNGNALNFRSQTAGRHFLVSRFCPKQRENFLVMPLPVSNSEKAFW